LLINPKICIVSSLEGANLFITKVFPTLFAFSMITNVILNCDGIYIYSKLFGKLLCRPLSLPDNCSLPLIVSGLCGYPLGAKYSCELYANKEIDFFSLQKLLNIASNCSPLFIVGTIGTVMLNNTNVSYIILISSYLSCFIIGLLLKSKKNYEKKLKTQIHNYSPLNLGDVLKKSVEASIDTCILVFGFIVIFSVFIGIIENITLFKTLFKSNIIKALILGILEMTNGCNAISLSHTSLVIKIMLLSFFTSFSGICVIFQVYSFTSKHNVPIFRYIILKLLQAIISSVLTLILYFLTAKSTFTFSPALSTVNKFDITVIIIIIFLLPFIVYKIIKYITFF
jgi:sporulation integral membrane protein YlbJ